MLVDDTNREVLFTIQGKPIRPRTATWELPIVKGTLKMKIPNMTFLLKIYIYDNFLVPHGTTTVVVMKKLDFHFKA